MELDIKQIVTILKSLAEEKNLPEEVVQDILEQALAAAWRRDNAERQQNVRAKINLNSGEVDAYLVYEVVEEVEDNLTQISLKEAQKLQAGIKVGQEIEEHYPVKNLGRVAAQTAKQVILQKMREAERDIILAEYEDRIGGLMTAIVSRAETKVVRFEIGQARGIMPLSEQIQGENYYIGQRLKVLIKEIDREGRQPQLILSRGSEKFLELLFLAEVPEMSNGAVEIKAIAREAGVRSKIAVASNVPNVDPVGTFVGGHGSRVQSVNSEIGDQEKIDIIVWAQEPKEFITNALSPTELLSIALQPAPEDGGLPRARVVVPKEQLSIAIGRNGQNVRLAGRLTGYEIDIIDESEVKTKAPPPRLARKEELEESLLEALEDGDQEESESSPETESDSSPTTKS